MCGCGLASGEHSVCSWASYTASLDLCLLIRRRGEGRVSHRAVEREVCKKPACTERALWKWKSPFLFPGTVFLGRFPRGPSTSLFQRSGRWRPGVSRWAWSQPVGCPRLPLLSWEPMRTCLGMLFAPREGRGAPSGGVNPWGTERRHCCQATGRLRRGRGGGEGHRPARSSSWKGDPRESSTCWGTDTRRSGRVLLYRGQA